MAATACPTGYFRVSPRRIDRAVSRPYRQRRLTRPDIRSDMPKRLAGKEDRAAVGLGERPSRGAGPRCRVGIGATRERVIASFTPRAARARRAAAPPGEGEDLRERGKSHVDEFGLAQARDAVGLGAGVPPGHPPPRPRLRPPGRHRRVEQQERTDWRGRPALPSPTSGSRSGTAASRHCRSRYRRRRARPARAPPAGGPICISSGSGTVRITPSW